LSNLLRDGPVGCVVDIDAGAHNGTFVPVKTSINPAHTTEDLPPCSTTATQLRSETVAFGYLRERLFLNSGSYNNDLWLSAMCAGFC
jgi:hypothetical protein